jgi:hypothetical protein
MEPEGGAVMEPPQPAALAATATSGSAAHAHTGGAPEATCDVGRSRRARRSAAAVVGSSPYTGYAKAGADVLVRRNVSERPCIVHGSC